MLDLIDLFCLLHIGRGCRMEDNEIIELFFQRSERAIEEVSKKYGGILNKIARNILNNPEDVKECVNDAYLGIWNSIPPNRPKSLITYICKIVRNLSLKKYRYNTAQKRGGYCDISFDELEECISTTTGGLDECTKEELVRVLEVFLDSLDKKSRIMFMKRYWFADSLSEIAKDFEMRENAVSVKLLRIRKKMKEYLEKEGISI